MLQALCQQNSAFFAQCSDCEKYTWKWVDNLLDLLYLYSFNGKPGDLADATPGSLGNQIPADRQQTIHACFRAVGSPLMEALAWAAGDNPKSKFYDDRFNRLFMLVQCSEALARDATLYRQSLEQEKQQGLSESLFTKTIDACTDDLAMLTYLGADQNGSERASRLGITARMTVAQLGEILKFMLQQRDPVTTFQYFADFFDQDSAKTFTVFYRFYSEFSRISDEEKQAHIFLQLLQQFPLAMLQRLLQQDSAFFAQCSDCKKHAWKWVNEMVALLQLFIDGVEAPEQSTANNETVIQNSANILRSLVFGATDDKAEAYRPPSPAQQQRLVVKLLQAKDSPLLKAFEWAAANKKNSQFSALLALIPCRDVLASEDRFSSVAFTKVLDTCDDDERYDDALMADLLSLDEDDEYGHDEL